MGNRIGTTPSSSVGPASGADDPNKSDNNNPGQGSDLDAGGQTDTPDRPVEGANLPAEGQNEADLIDAETSPPSPTDVPDREEPDPVDSRAADVDEPEPQVDDSTDYELQTSRRDRLFSDFKNKAEQVMKGNPDTPETQMAIQEFSVISDELMDMQDVTRDHYESRDKTQDKRNRTQQRRDQQLSEQQFRDVKRTFQRVRGRATQWDKTVKTQRGKESVHKFEKNALESQRRMALVEAKRNHAKQQDKMTLWNQLVYSSGRDTGEKKQRLKPQERLKYQAEAKEEGGDEGVEGDIKLTPKERTQIKKDADDKRRTELARLRGIIKPEEEHKADKKREKEIKKELADLHDEHKGVKDPTKAQLRSSIAALRHADKLTKKQADDLLQKLEEAAGQAADRMHAGAEAMVAKKERGLSGLIKRAGRLIAKGRTHPPAPLSYKAREGEDPEEDASTVRYVFERAWEVFSNAGLMQAEQKISSGGGANLSTTAVENFEGGQEAGQLAFSRVMQEKRTEFKPSPFNHFNHWSWSREVTAGRLREDVGRV